MNNIALAVDFELNPFKVLCGASEEWEVTEVGLTEVDLVNRKILKKVSFPIKCEHIINDEIATLTGWTYGKLQKVGYNLLDVCEKLETKYGARNRLIIVDQWGELDPLRTQLYHTEEGFHAYPFGSKLFNIADFYRIRKNDFTDQSMSSMLKGLGLEFIGKPHRAADDSYNIARIFLELIK